MPDNDSSTQTQSKRPVIVIDNQEDDDWIKTGKGYKDEVAIHQQLAKQYAAKKKKPESKKIEESDNGKDIPKKHLEGTEHDHDQSTHGRRGGAAPSSGKKPKAKEETKPKEVSQEAKSPESASEEEDDLYSDENLDKLVRAKLATVVEPEKVVTPDLQELSTANGGEMFGLKHRFKSVESFTRKVKDDIEDSVGVPLADIVENVNDGLRYTVVYDEENYTDRVDATLDALMEKGYKPYDSKFKNYWGRDDYKGLNLVLGAPDGTRFELQFHTPTSIKTKVDESHPIYEKLRVSTSPKETTAYYNQLLDVWRPVTPPNNYRLLDGLEWGWTDSVLS